MAWRIHEQVIRGEIDNRERGRVVGRLWLSGRAEPIELDLAGDCWRDLAGRLLKFTNPEPESRGRDGLTTEQKGKVGDITASRKVKVPDIPLDEIGEYYVAKKPFPWHWGNALYLEWFSHSNGRVVVESASYELTIVGEPAWEMSPEEEKLQRIANEKAMTDFMDTVTEAADAAASEDVDWNASPMSEDEADLALHRNDILTDRIHARMEREGEDADLGQIIKEEIERLDGPTSKAGSGWKESLPDFALELGDGFEGDEFVDFEHDLVERAQELAVQVLQEKRDKEWVPEGAMEEHPAAYLLESVTKAGAKLAGALNGQVWPPRIENCGMIIARLKRARVYLDDAITALESCQEQKLIDFAAMGVILVEVIDIAKEADAIIAELRARLKDGR